MLLFSIYNCSHTVLLNIDLLFKACFHDSRLATYMRKIIYQCTGIHVYTLSDNAATMLFGYIWLTNIASSLRPALQSHTSPELQLKILILIRQDTVKLYNIFGSMCCLKKDNGFLYLLPFPSLIESQTKVKQYKGFFVSYKKHLSKHIVQGHAGAINNPLRPASHRLVQV